MATPRAASLPHPLEDHYEELEFLWAQRRFALRSPAYSPGELARLEARIEAQVQGLLVAGATLADFLRPKLHAGRAHLAFAAAYPLLRSGREADRRAVRDAFLPAAPPARAGICEALCQATPAAPRRDVLGSWGEDAAAVVLAFRMPAESVTEGLIRALLVSGAPELRRSGWRAVALRGEPLADDLYRTGLSDPDATVRGEMLWAAAWSGRRDVLDHCRLLAARPAPESGEAVRLLAVLGAPDDLPLLRDACRSPSLGPGRFETLGAFGHPAGVEDLLAAMLGDDLRSAVAAGRAFARLTGFAVDSERRVELPPADGSAPDAFERAFLEDAFLPDAAATRAYWRGARARFAGGTRWCRGFDLSGGAPEEVLGQLDREAFWEARLRGKFDGRWRGRLADLERFPQREG